MTRADAAPTTIGELLAQRVAEALDGTLLDHPGAFVDASVSPDGLTVDVLVSFEYDDPDAPAVPSRGFNLRVRPL